MIHREFKRSIFIVCATIVGAAPGVILVWRGWPTGEAIAAFGGLIGGLVAWHRISLARFLVLLFVGVFGKSIPELGDSMIDRTESKLGPEIDDPLTRWLAEPSPANNEWLILASLATGAILCPAMCAIDYSGLRAGRPATFLREITPRDSFLEQTLLITVVLTVWIAALSALCVSRTYRRWILLCSAGAATGAGLIGLHSPRIWVGIFGFSTMGAGFGLFIACMIHRAFAEEERTAMSSSESKTGIPGQKSLDSVAIFDDERTYAVLGVVLGCAFLPFIFIQRQRVEPAAHQPPFVNRSVGPRASEVPDEIREAALRNTRILMGEPIDGADSPVESENPKSE